MPASSAALEKEAKLRETPGSPSEVATNARLSVPKNDPSTTAAAPLNVLWPETHSGNGGVTSSGSHVVSATVPGLPSVSAARIAVTGRQKLKTYLHSQAAMPASAMAML